LEKNTALGESANEHSAATVASV